MDFYQLSAAELVKEYQKQQFSVTEVVESFIHRIEEKNKEVNEIVFPLFEQAQKEAIILDDMLLKGNIKGHLHGVPITIKRMRRNFGRITPSTS